MRRQIKTEHTIANTALREHSIAQAVRSQVNYFVGKVMIDIANLAESQAVLVPAINVVGKTAKESGYQVS
jgi:ATP-dependent protease Clp ATPase subunit